MSDPWLSIIGIGEDGLAGLSPASRAALDAAGQVFGAPRHLALAGVRGQAWPVPFSLDPLLTRRGQPTAMLVSGDPFWHGAGGSVAAVLSPDEWRAFPVPGTFSLAAARLGWRIEDTLCLGLHAMPFARLRRDLTPGGRAICLLRDGDAPAALAKWLTEQGFGASRLWVMERLGGTAERVRQTTAERFAAGLVAAAADARSDTAGGEQPEAAQVAAQAAPSAIPCAAPAITAPVAVAIEMAGNPGLPRSPGLPDATFAHDGQITKSPVRALTLAALAPRRGELLWDLGAGSGSVAVEWCLAGGRALAVETRADRAANIRANAASFGVDLRVIEARSADAIAELPDPAAVFVGGGFDAALFSALWDRLPSGARLVVNGVTLETETLLARLYATHGGQLLRIELARAAPLGGMTGWEPARPVVQWSVAR